MTVHDLQAKARERLIKDLPRWIVSFDETAGRIEFGQRAAVFSSFIERTGGRGRLGHYLAQCEADPHRLFADVLSGIARDPSSTLPTKWQLGLLALLIKGDVTTHDWDTIDWIIAERSAG
ncbi:hypothetical protein ACN2XU_22815 [Primorskyibacter sp. 2E107]